MYLQHTTLTIGAFCSHQLISKGLSVYYPKNQKESSPTTKPYNINSRRTNKEFREALENNVPIVINSSSQLLFHCNMTISLVKTLS